MTRASAVVFSAGAQFRAVIIACYIRPCPTALSRDSPRSSVLYTTVLWQGIVHMRDHDCTYILGQIQDLYLWYEGKPTNPHRGGLTSGEQEQYVDYCIGMWTCTSYDDGVGGSIDTRDIVITSLEGRIGPVVRIILVLHCCVLQTVCCTASRTDLRLLLKSVCFPVFVPGALGTGIRSSF